MVISANTILEVEPYEEIENVPPLKPRPQYNDEKTKQFILLIFIVLHSIGFLIALLVGLAFLIKRACCL